MRGIDFACPDIYIKSFSYGQERTANAASGRTRSGIRSDDDAGEGQLPGRLQRQMGDSFQPPCRFHAYLHLGGAYFRRPHCGVQGAELRADRSFGGQPQQPYRVAAHDPRKDRIQGHEGYKGGISDYRRRVDEGCQSLRHDPARRKPDRCRARRVLRRSQGRAAGDDLLSAGAGSQFRRNQARAGGLAGHRRVRRGDAGRLASGRRGDRSDEGRGHERPA